MQWDVIRFFVRSMLIILINKYVKFIKIQFCSLNYFSVAIRHHDEGNLLEGRVIWRLPFQRYGSPSLSWSRVRAQAVSQS